MALLRRLALPLLMAAACAVSGCAYNADIGRDQLLIVNDDNLAAEGEKAWADTLPRFAHSPAALDHGRYARFEAFLHDAGLVGSVLPVAALALDPGAAE